MLLNYKDLFLKLEQLEKKVARTCCWKQLIDQLDPSTYLPQLEKWIITKNSSRWTTLVACTLKFWNAFRIYR